MALVSPSWTFSLCLSPLTWLRHQDLPNCCACRLLRHVFLSLCFKLTNTNELHGFHWSRSVCHTFPDRIDCETRVRGFSLRIPSSRIVRQFCLVHRYQFFGGTSCLHFQDSIVIVTLCSFVSEKFQSSMFVVEERGMSHRYQETFRRILLQGKKWDVSRVVC